MKKNVLIFGFLQLLVCMPMALLSSEEGLEGLNQENQGKKLLREAMEEWHIAHHKTGKGNEKVRANRRQVVSREGVRRCQEEKAKLKDDLGRQLEEIENDKTLSKEKKRTEKRKLLIQKRDLATPYSRSVKGGV